jgi:hypothetical protein
MRDPIVIEDSRSEVKNLLFTVYDFFMVSLEQRPSSKVMILIKILKVGWEACPRQIVTFHPVFIVFSSMGNFKSIQLHMSPWKLHGVCGGVTNFWRRTHGHTDGRTHGIKVPPQ